MKQELVIATKNLKKAAEIKQMLAGLDLDITTLRDYGSSPEIIEDADSFEGNAIKKAVIAARYTGKMALADDSGLVVNALGNEPGILSARYAGIHGNDRKNITKLLRRMRNLNGEKRTAEFVCVVALAQPAGLLKVVQGKCRGTIIRQRRGKNGFGYDPVFYFPRLKKTFAELLPEIKNKVSHRNRAIARARLELKKILESEKNERVS